MKKTFLIYCEVDTGYSYERDTALVEAENKREAIDLLKERIRTLGNEYRVTGIFDVSEYTGCVFTRCYGDI